MAQYNKLAVEDLEARTLRCSSPGGGEDTPLPLDEVLAAANHAVRAVRSAAKDVKQHEGEPRKTSVPGNGRRRPKPRRPVFHTGETTRLKMAVKVRLRRLGWKGPNPPDEIERAQLGRDQMSDRAAIRKELKTAALALHRGDLQEIRHRE